MIIRSTKNLKIKTERYTFHTSIEPHWRTTCVEVLLYVVNITAIKI